MLCLYDPTKTAAGVGYVFATIPNEPVVTPTVGCVIGGCTYEFCYDENLLADPTSALVPCDIKSVERLSCLIEYIETFITSPVSDDPNNVIVLGEDNKAFLDCEDIAACAASLVSLYASAHMGEDSVSSAAFAAATPKLMDLEVIDSDLLSMITVGAAWKVTVPVAGAYFLTAEAESESALWGNATGNFSSWTIQYSINGGTKIDLNRVSASDIDNVAAEQGLVVEGSKLLLLAAADYVQLFAVHTDSETHVLNAGNLTRFSIFRIGPAVLPP